MENFYKIPKVKADLIGKFEYKDGCVFDPFCSEQVDGTYLVSVYLVEELKDNENILKVDWSKLEVINQSQINNKIVSL